ncbi:MAG: hypothetical protein KJP17_09000 [Gammaproteobacteria bacterium]|nr:hypothetical protein [Gammaproteobacteria bacterium]
MSEIDDWLERYENSHADLHNPLVYWAAVPMLVVGTVGLLWHLPIPAEFAAISPLLNWGSAFLMATAIYYFIISLSLAIGMLPFLLGLAAIHLWLDESRWPQLGISVALLAAGTVGLWLGRRGNGGVRAITGDFQLMMIGPLWLLSVMYKRFNVPF